jgi:hypothetical protein
LALAAGYGLNAALAQNTATILPPEETGIAGSVYVSMDSWIYPAFARLQALGYADTSFLGLRPWTRLTCLHILEETQKKIETATDSPGNREARELFSALAAEFGGDDRPYVPGQPNLHLEFDRAYTRQQYMSGDPVNNSYHLGQTLINDYGRPYEDGFETYDGFQGRAEYARLALDVRGEVQHAPGAGPYPEAVYQFFTLADDIPLEAPTPIPQANDFRLLDANLSFNFANHEISVGKSEDWWGPDQGGAMAWSTNAEPIYALRINRTEPLLIPLLSKLTGPFRYEGIFGELKQQYPKNPWVHAEKFNFKPTPNLELGFSRVVVFAGEGHVPLTFGSFWRSFTSFSGVSPADKFSRDDPGARHSSFDFNYRLPFVRNWLTLYSDSIVHDDASPVDAPRHAGISPGLYLSHFPKLPKLDLRVEGVDTAPSIPGKYKLGQYIYWEAEYRQAYTNKGQLFGSWIGREGKGGQAWITYWLNPQSKVVLGYRNAKNTIDFVPGGTTQNDFNAQVILRVKKDLELNAFAQYERWNEPILKPGPQNQFTGSVQLTWYPKLSRSY